MAETGFERCSSDDWLKFLERSPQACFYNHPAVLEAFDLHCDYWFLTSKGVPAVGIAITTRDGQPAVLPHTYYNGPAFHPDAWRGKHHKQTLRVIELSDALMEHLSGAYTRVAFALHPTITDVRGFDWFHYHEPKLGRCQISVRYTARIDTREGIDAVLAEIHSTRRQESGYASSREGLVFESGGGVEELVALYRETFERQGAKATAEDERAIEILHTVLSEQGRSELGFVRNAEGRAVAGALLMFDFDGTCHVPVVGVGDTRYGGSLLYRAIAERAIAREAGCVDLNGANSPSRSYFKHSMAARTTLYFEIEWSAP